MNTSSEQKQEFLFANCQQCNGLLRFPITVRPDSGLICPHCDQEVNVGEVLAEQVPEVKYATQSPPPLAPSAGSKPSTSANSNSDSENLDSIVIETKTNEQTEQQDGKFVVPPQLAAGIRKRSRRRRSSSQSRSRSQSRESSSKGLSEADEIRRQRREEHIRQKKEKQKQEMAEQAKMAAIPRPQPTRTPSSSRRKAPRRNPIVEGIKVVIGGLLAIPIAYLLLMWIFYRDPLGIAGQIHSAAPYLVPEALVAAEEEGDSDSKKDLEPSVDTETSIDRRDIDLGQNDSN